MDDTSTELMKPLAKRLGVEADVLARLLVGIAEKVYDDAGARPLRRVAEILDDSLAFVGTLPKWARQRAEMTMADALARVPEERRTKAPLALVGPCLEGSRYHDSGSPLYEMFAELLARALDDVRQGEAHPAFPGIIAQLAPDEARIIDRTRLHPAISVHRMMHPDYDPSDKLEMATRSVVRPFQSHPDEYWGSDWYWENIDGINRADMMQVYYEHLDKLGLVELPLSDESARERAFTLEGRSEEPRTTRIYDTLYTLRLTNFGMLFVEACIPEDNEWDW